MSTKGNVLIIDDEENIRHMLEDILNEENYTTFTAGEWEEAHKKLLQEKIDVILLDVWLPKIGGMDILDILKKDFEAVEVIIISGHGNIDIAVKAIKNGAFDFLEKPLSIEKILTVLENALRMKQLKEENISLKTTISKEYEMVGDSKPINQIKKKISAAAMSNARVLITGENGTGKELIARSIHFQSNRRNKPFVEVNCAAIPENLIESELFGHEKGSFTGAVSQKKGKFEIAHTGTIFLDEVADMSLSTQAKVLRVLEQMNFQRIGGTDNINVDVRVISATNKNIQEMINQGTFREDLFYRLNVVPIHNPSLRERKEDIPLLVEHFLAKYAQQSGLPKKKLKKDAVNYLKDYEWPGNIRQLKNFIERIIVLTETDEISINNVKHHLQTPGAGAMDKAENVEQLSYESFDDLELKEARELFEKQFIEKKLLTKDYNISATAKLLGIERSNLHKKINQYGIEVER